MEHTSTATQQVETLTAGTAKGGRYRSSPTSKVSQTTRWRKLILGISGVLLVGVVWELYKFLGPEKGFVIGDLILLPRTNDMSMPHIATMFERLSEPLTGASNSILMWQAVVDASAFSLYVAAVGWIVGVSVGLLLALIMQRFRTAHTNKYIQQALDELKADGVDVMGANYTPITVTLKEGGK